MGAQLPCIRLDGQFAKKGERNGIASELGHPILQLGGKYANFSVRTALISWPAPSAFRKRKIRNKVWHQSVPEPEEIVHIVFEKYWSGSRRMSKSASPRVQIFLAVSSVLSNLATCSTNKHFECGFFSSRRWATNCRTAAARESDLEDSRTPSPDHDSTNREEVDRLKARLGGNKLDDQVLDYILGRSEASGLSFRRAVCPRVIAHELNVPRQAVDKSLERLRRAVHSARGCSFHPTVALAN